MIENRKKYYGSVTELLSSLLSNASPLILLFILAFCSLLCRLCYVLWDFSFGTRYKDSLPTSMLGLPLCQMGRFSELFVHCGNPSPAQRPWRPRGRLWRQCTTDFHQMAPLRALVPIIEMRSPWGAGEEACFKKHASTLRPRLYVAGYL